MPPHGGHGVEVELARNADYCLGELMGKAACSGEFVKVGMRWMAETPRPVTPRQNFASSLAMLAHGGSLSEGKNVATPLDTSRKCKQHGANLGATQCGVASCCPPNARRLKLAVLLTARRGSAVLLRRIVAAEPRHNRHDIVLGAGGRRDREPPPC